MQERRGVDGGAVLPDLDGGAVLPDPGVSVSGRRVRLASPRRRDQHPSEYATVVVLSTSKR
uniref:Uncharacterized protein n=1 Tax=Oryza nivara TaxID=4536 RepID=A0A0E0G5X7_ORYNI